MTVSAKFSFFESLRWRNLSVAGFVCMVVTVLDVKSMRFILSPSWSKKRREVMPALRWESRLNVEVTMLPTASPPVSVPATVSSVGVKVLVLERSVVEVKSLLMSAVGVDVFRRERLTIFVNPEPDAKKTMSPDGAMHGCLS
jgi:hypothetical protein